MTKTLLDGINEILKRTGVIAGDAGEITSLTDGSRQRSIDIAVQVINEGIDELYSAAKKALPNIQAESSLSLVAGTRAYTLATDLVSLRWPLVDKTNNQFIFEFAGGYNAILLYDPGQTYTGLPAGACIRPTDGKLYLDRAPTSIEAGKVYTYQYDKDLELTLSTDNMPFSNAVFRAMVPAWVQLWKREMRNEFDVPLFQGNIGRASLFLTKSQPRTSYNPRG